MLFSCLVAGAMNTFHLIGEGSMEALNTFNGSTGFLDLYILVLITGSVLSVDRKMLIKSFAGFIPTILAGIAGALGLAGLVGAITGVGAIEAIATYAIPVMGGGNGAGITPMSKMWLLQPAVMPPPGMHLPLQSSALAISAPSSCLHC